MPKRTIIPLYAIVLGIAVCIPVKPSNSENNSLNKLPGHVADNFAIEELLASGDSDLALADPERVTLLWSTTSKKGWDWLPPDHWPETIRATSAGNPPG